MGCLVIAIKQLPPDLATIKKNRLLRYIIHRYLLLPEGGYLGDERVQDCDVTLERRVVGLDLVPHRRHRHVEEALDLRVAADSVPFCKSFIFSVWV